MSWQRNSKFDLQQNHKKIRQAQDDEAYFNNHSDDDGQGNDISEQNNNVQGKSESQDPLDAFMDGIQQKIEKQKLEPPKQKIKSSQKQFLKQINDIGNNYRNQEQQQNELNMVFGGELNQQKFMEDRLSDGENQEEGINANNRGKIIEPLKPFDFSNVVLEDFDKNFYEQHEDIANISADMHKKLLKQFQIKISGAEPLLKPVVSFSHLPLTQRMIKVACEEGFQKPTPIQAQALPIAFSGRDVVGIAKTGSGKTLAYVWPMIVHALHQRRSDKGDGPIGLVLAPTRQLCQQIYLQTKRYGKKQGIKIDCLLGGQNKHDQWKSLKAGVDILIASPGRLIQFLRKKATNLLRTTYLVLDEADKMLSMGFQQQIRSIVSQTRDDRQTLLFTATMKKSIQFLAADIVSSSVRIMVGDQTSANQDVKQQVIIVNDYYDKINWIQSNITRLIADGKVLIFVNQKIQCDKIQSFLNNQLKIASLTLHGDKSQYQRTIVMNSFKNEASVLIATDIASRGIDVKNIKTVINVECPKNIEVYIHRIGRAGRAGQMGISYTFLEKTDTRFAIGLVGIFENSGYPVPDELQDLAMLDDGFRRKRISSKMGVSFAKGKDATKYLNFALKRQKKGNNRAGLGLQQFQRSNKTNNNQLNLSKESSKLDSISQISTMIRQKLKNESDRHKFDGHFVLSSHQQKNQTKQCEIIYMNKKPKQQKPSQ